MSKGEFTLSVYSDYTKAFDTVQHHTIIQTLHKIGFSTSALKWFISYLGNRLPYVQVNNSKSATDRVIFVFCKGLYWVHCYLISPQTISQISILLILYINVNTLTILHNTSTSKSHRFDKQSKTFKSLWTNQTLGRKTIIFC